jgi:hypothetical protein
VAGGIFAHNIDFLHHILHEWPSILKELLLGVLGGVIVVILVKIIKKVLSLFKKG